MAKKNSIQHKYKIIITQHQKEVEYIGGFRNVKDTYKTFNELKKASKNVKFPIKFINGDKIFPAKYELLILERNDNKKSMLPNEYGKTTEHVITNNDNWKIREKINYYKEEHFWYLGYHPRYDRKNVDFIVDSIDRSQSKEILRYKNKIVIRYFEDIQLITCKNRDDSKRLMAYLMKRVKPSSKTTYFNNLSISSKREIERVIQEKTGWTLRKIRRSNTRP